MVKSVRSKVMVKPWPAAKGKSTDAIFVEPEIFAQSGVSQIGRSVGDHCGCVGP